MQIKIILADDHSLFREGLVRLLECNNKIQIIGEANDGDEVVDLCCNLMPDIVLMDIGMPKINGIEATRRILAKQPKLGVIFLSMYSDKQFIKEALEAGAMGYLFKNCTYNELITSIENVYSGHKYLTPKATEIIIQDYIRIPDNSDINKIDLTNREKEILQLFAEGNSTAQIADQLFLSVKTVGTHKQNILEKLNLKSTTEMIKFALKKGLISLD